MVRRWVPWKSNWKAIMVGATRCTQIEASSGSSDAPDRRRAEQAAPVVPPPVSKSRAKSIEAAERRLARAGT